MEEIPPTESTSYSPESQPHDSSDSLETSRVDRGEADPGTTGSLPERLENSPHLTAIPRVVQEPASQLLPFYRLFGDLRNTLHPSHSGLFVPSSALRDLRGVGAQFFDPGSQFGTGGVERSGPNVSPVIVDPPNLSTGQSSTTNAANQRWPSCPRCGANVQTRRALPHVARDSPLEICKRLMINPN